MASCMLFEVLFLSFWVGMCHIIKVASEAEVLLKMRRALQGIKFFWQSVDDDELLARRQMRNSSSQCLTAIMCLLNKCKITSTGLLFFETKSKCPSRKITTGSLLILQFVCHKVPDANVYFFPPLVGAWDYKLYSTSWKNCPSRRVSE